MKIICIVGPTGVGKTKLSIMLAKYLDADILNADSTQVYKDLNIATAKIKEEEKEGIKHYLLDTKNIDEEYTVYDYQKDGRLILDEHIKNDKNIIIVGGTGLYIKALLYDYQFNDLDNSYQFDELSDEELYNKLLEVDPNTDIHINNRKRVAKALNYYLANQKPYSEKEKTDKLLYDVTFIGLTCSRDILYNNINNRVDKMFEDGLEEEAYKIYKTGIRTRAVLTPIGYNELFSYFDKLITKEDAIELMKRRSRHYAKRQYTWFLNQMDIKWFDVDINNFEKTYDEILKYLDI